MYASQPRGMPWQTPFGGILFDSIGWEYTNLACSAILLLPLLAFSSTVCAPVPPKASESSHLKIWQSPKFVAVNFIGLVALAGMYAYVPYLQPFFARQFGVGKTGYGLIMMGAMIVGFMSGNVASIAIEQSFGTLTSLGVGLTFFGLGYLLLGPSPLLPFLPTTGTSGLVMACIAWAVLLFGNAFPVILGAPLSMKFAMEYGLDEDEASAQTAMFSIILMALGLCIGPVFGGLSASKYGVPWTNTFLGINALVFSVLGLFMLNRLGFAKKKLPSLSLV